MGVEAIRGGLSSQAVHPGRDAHDDRKPSAREEGSPKRAKRDARPQAEPQLVRNALGEVIGKAIDITA